MLFHKALCMVWHASSITILPVFARGDQYRVTTAIARRNTAIIGTHALILALHRRQTFPFLAQVRSFLVDRLCRYLLRTCPVPSGRDLEQIRVRPSVSDVFTTEALSSTTSSLLPYYVMKQIVSEKIEIDTTSKWWQRFDRIYGDIVRGT